MAEEQEGLPQNPAQMMLERNRAAAKTAIDRRQDLLQKRVGSRVQGLQDEAAFTPEDEPFEMEGAAAPKEKEAPKAAPPEKKAAPKPKSFRGKGDFEYEFDEESQAFTIVGAPEQYKHLKGKKVTSGKAYDSIKAEMDTGTSLYEAPEPVSLPEIMPEDLEALSDEQQELLKGSATASHAQMIGGTGDAGSEGRLQNLHSRVKLLMRAVDEGMIRPYEFEAKTGFLLDDARDMIAASDERIGQHEAGFEAAKARGDLSERPRPVYPQRRIDNPLME